MKKKTIIIVSVILIIILISLILLKNNNKEKFYLDDKYYNNSSPIEIDNNDMPESGNYILFTYNNYCTLPIPCEYIFDSFMSKYNISFISIPFEEFKKTSYYKKVKYAPTVIIIKNGKIVTYLDANSDEDLDKYQNLEEFEKWISKYIYLNKIN